MQRALVRHLDDTYEEYFFSYGSCVGYVQYDSTEKLPRSFRVFALSH